MTAKKATAEPKKRVSGKRQVQWFIDGAPRGTLVVPRNRPTYSEDGETITIDAPPIDIGGHTYELRTVEEPS